MTPHPWWLGMPPIDAEADCQGTMHVIRWAEGGLDPLNHSNPDGEALLIALGGDATGCLEIATSWDQHARDVRFLACAPRSRTDRLAITGADLAEVGRHLTNIVTASRTAWPRRAVERLVALDPQRVDAATQRRQHFAFRSLGLAASVMASGEAGWQNHVGLLELFTMPRALLDRLQLEVWENKLPDLRKAVASAPGAYSRERSALLAAAIARVRAAVIGWLSPPSMGPDPVVSVQFTPDDAALRVSRVAEAGYAAEVGCDWVAGVFGRQMALVDGNLVLEIVELDEGTAAVWALPPQGTSAPVKVELVRRRDVDAWGWPGG